jgi:hypothetical protein
MKVLRDSLVPRRKRGEGVDWVGPINKRYVAVWPGWGAKFGAADPRVFDTTALPDSLPEVTSAVPASVLPYVATPLGAPPADGKGWFQCETEDVRRLALLDTSGAPATWYGISGGKKGQAVFLIWDVADPKRPVLLSQLRHPELQVARGEGFWTAQGHVLAAAHGIVVVTSYASGPPQVIDARDPRHPKFVMRLPYQGRLPHHGNEMTDCRADGPWFYIKSYPDAVQLWDFSQPDQPRQIWEETGGGPYGAYSWQAGVPVGPVLLVPQLSVLKVMTVPRPSQVPAGTLTWR